MHTFIRTLALATGPSTVHTRPSPLPLPQGFDVNAHVAIGGEVYHCQMDVAVISGSGLLGASPFSMNPYARVLLLGSDGSKVAEGATGAVKRGGDNPKFSSNNVCAMPYVVALGV